MALTLWAVDVPHISRQREAKMWDWANLKKKIKSAGMWIIVWNSTVWNSNC